MWIFVDNVLVQITFLSMVAKIDIISCRIKGYRDCIVLKCTILFWVMSYCIEVYDIVLGYVVLYWSVRYCFRLCSIVLFVFVMTDSSITKICTTRYVRILVKQLYKCVYLYMNVVCSLVHVYNIILCDMEPFYL